MLYNKNIDILICDIVFLNGIGYINFLLNGLGRVIMPNISTLRKKTLFCIYLYDPSEIVCEIILSVVQGQR